MFVGHRHLTRARDTTLPSGPTYTACRYHLSHLRGDLLLIYLSQTDEFHATRCLAHGHLFRIEESMHSATTRFDWTRLLRCATSCASPSPGETSPYRLLNISPEYPIGVQET